MFCYAAAKENSRKLTGSYWMRNLEIIPMTEKLKGKKQRVKPLDILSRYKFFLPFNSSESAGGHKTCRDTLNANLPALPWTGYTVSNTVHTTSGISSIPPAPLPTIPDSNWIKGNLSTKKNNKPIKSFVLKKKPSSVLSFLSRTFSQSTGLWKTMWILMLSPVRCETDAAVPHQRQSP